MFKYYIFEHLKCRLSYFLKTSPRQGKRGSSDITLQNKNNGKWVFMSSKFYLDDSKKSIDNYDVEKILAIVNNTHINIKNVIFILL